MGVYMTSWSSNCAKKAKPLIVASEAQQSPHYALTLMHGEEIATSLPALRQAGSS
jgi:hypothetical protein